MGSVTSAAAEDPGGGPKLGCCRQRQEDLVPGEAGECEHDVNHSDIDSGDDKPARVFTASAIAGLPGKDIILDRLRLGVLSLDVPGAPAGSAAPPSPPSKDLEVAQSPKSPEVDPDSPRSPASPALSDAECETPIWSSDGDPSARAIDLLSERCDSEPGSPFLSPVVSGEIDPVDCGSAPKQEDDESQAQRRRRKRYPHRQLLITNTMEMKPSSALQLIIEKSGDVSDHYKFSKELGKGTFGIVQKAELKVTGAMRAVKTILKAPMKNHRHLLKKEIEIMKMVDHPNLLMLFEIFENEKNVYLVLELCEGGTLQCYCQKHGALSEDETVRSMQMILRATRYLHSHLIVHRDIKCDNCLITGDTLQKSQIKLCDFGLACELPSGCWLTRPCGTPTHMSPEVIAKKYRMPADLWSCGVVCFQLLSTGLPFHGATIEELRKNIQRAVVSYDEKWMYVSNAGCSFVRGLLTKNPKQRMTAEAALSHEWFEEHAHVKPPKLPFQQIIMDLRKFRRQNKLRRAALHVIVSMLGEAEIGQARNHFLALDLNGDGRFSVEELETRMRQEITVPNTSKGLSALRFQSKDVFGPDISEDIQDFTYTEFLAATFDRRSAVKRKKIMHAAFNSFDINGDGKVSVSELAAGRLLGKLRIDELESALEEIDADGDALMDYQEFVNMMREPDK